MRIASICPGFIISVLISLFLVFSLLLSLLFGIFSFLAVLSALAYLIIDFPLFPFFQKKAGTVLLLKAIPYSSVDHLMADFGVVSGCIGCLNSLLIRCFLKPQSRTAPREDLLPVGEG